MPPTSPARWDCTAAARAPRPIDFSVDFGDLINPSLITPLGVPAPVLQPIARRLDRQAELEAGQARAAWSGDLRAGPPPGWSACNVLGPQYRPCGVPATLSSACQAKTGTSPTGLALLFLYPTWYEGGARPRSNLPPHMAQQPLSTKSNVSVEAPLLQGRKWEGWEVSLASCTPPAASENPHPYSAVSV